MDYVKYYYIDCEEEKYDIMRDELNYVIDKCCINKNKRCKDCDSSYYDYFNYFDCDLIICERRNITYEYTFNNKYISGNCKRFYYPHKFRITYFNVIKYINCDGTYYYAPNFFKFNKYLIEYNHLTDERKYNI